MLQQQLIKPTAATPKAALHKTHRKGKKKKGKSNVLQLNNDWLSRPSTQNNVKDQRKAIRIRNLANTKRKKKCLFCYFLFFFLACRINFFNKTGNGRLDIQVYQQG